MTTRKKDHLDQLTEEFVGGDPKLARKVGTTVSVICRMEQADHDGSLARRMKNRSAGSVSPLAQLTRANHAAF
jgi:hypothetical protein